MKPNKPILLHIPALLVKEINKHIEINKPSFNYDIVYFYYIVHYILVKLLRQKNQEFVSISKKLKFTICSQINEYIRFLKNGEFIISDDKFIKGKKSIWYKINPIYFVGYSKFEIKPDCELFNKIIKRQRAKKAHYNRSEPFLKRMKDEFMKVELDYQKAEKWILSQPDERKKIMRLIALNQFEDHRFRYFCRNKTNNRLDTNLTSIKRELKQFIIGNYVNIDLKNSQPFFLSMLLKSILTKDNNTHIPLCYYLEHNNIIKTFGIKRIGAVSKIHQNEEKPFLVNLKDFDESVTRGKLYDDFILKYYGRVKEEDYEKIRDGVKDIMFMVFFSNNEQFGKFGKYIPYKKEKGVFASVYPYIYESIKRLKTKDNTILPIFLQKIESFIFIDSIAKELVNSGIIPKTVHDSVIVKKEHEKRTIEIMNKIFLDNFGIIPTFDVKNLRED
jgi:hypothetical protein